MTRKTIIVDLDKCFGCHSCAVVCKQENEVRLGLFYNKVSKVGPSGKFPDVEVYFLPMMCQQCDEPKCVSVCPANATSKRADGVVVIDEAECIGCKRCIKACPYGARSYDKEKDVVVKCTLCAHRLDAGEQPACVLSCPAHARIFGDLDDPQSEVSLAARNAGSRLYHLVDERAKPNKPKVGYILSKQKWRSADARLFEPQDEKSDKKS